MPRRGGTGLWRNESGAAAALYALALPALVIVAGVGFDYARLVGLDSELQNAADQAALAAVTQLDGKANACARAANAANNLVANQTLLSNDGLGRAITVANEADCDAVGAVRFWATVDGDGNGVTAATSDADAKYVEIVLEERSANYAFTPIAGVFAGDLSASAMAGLSSAICKAAVLYMCNMEGTGETFDIANYIGVGINVTKEGKNGNWGFVGPDNSNPTLRKTLGLDSTPQACVTVSGAVDVSPGNDANKQVVDAFNTRFDMGGLNDCPVAGGCSASANTNKDLVKTNAQSCGDWQEASKGYSPTTNAPLPVNGSSDPDAMGYPRDICHAVSANGVGCNGPSSDRAVIGDGVWDAAAYFRVNYGITNWDTNPQLSDLPRNGKGGLPLRYDVYKWELEHKDDVIGTRKPLDQRTVNGNRYARGAPQCFPRITPGPTTVDRRLISVAVVSKAECNKIKGNSYNPEVQQWVDAFLIEPMADRSKTYTSAGGTSAKEIYVEIVRATPAGGQAESAVRRDVPYLLR